MTFISYAQNYEDVILRRALKDVEKGFYIDVGANDPTIDSVTKYFYDAGWRGINIEPVTEWYKKLKQNRPRDINLQIAAGNRKGEANFYEVIGTGLSTMVNSIAEDHAQKLGYKIKSYKVPVTQLSSICQEHPNPTIHFLKIDVEGAEKSVLLGMNLKKIRPWILLVESTCPNSPNENHVKWEPILLAADYEFAYFDGLNRFYVAKEHQEIKKNLAIPPNVFDNFQLSGTSNSSVHYQIAEVWKKGALLEKQQQQLKTLVQSLELELGEAKTQQQQLKTLVQSLELELGEAKTQQQQLKTLVQSLQEQALHSERTLTDYKKQIDELQQSYLHWKIEAERLNAELLAVYDSKSWRITLPLRKLWKPFESKQNLAADESADESIVRTSEIADGANAHNEAEPLLKGSTGREKLSIDEILSRIRAELVNTSQEKQNK